MATPGTVEAIGRRNGNRTSRRSPWAAAQRLIAGILREGWPQLSETPACLDIPGQARELGRADGLERAGQLEAGVLVLSLWRYRFGSVMAEQEAILRG